MRTSLTDTENIENWLLEQGDIQERLVTEAKVISSSNWEDKAHWQSESYDLIRLYGREKLRLEIRDVERSVFNSKKYNSFQKLIKSIFNC